MGGRLWYKYYCEKKREKSITVCCFLSLFLPLPPGVLPLPSGFPPCHQVFSPCHLVFPLAIRFSLLQSGFPLCHQVFSPCHHFYKKKILLPFAIWFFPLSIQSSPHGISFPPAPPAIRFSPLAIRCCDPAVTWMPTLFVWQAKWTPHRVKPWPWWQLRWWATRSPSLLAPATGISSSTSSSPWLSGTSCSPYAYSPMPRSPSRATASPASRPTWTTSTILWKSRWCWSRPWTPI